MRKSNWIMGRGSGWMLKKGWKLPRRFSCKTPKPSKVWGNRSHKVTKTCQPRHMAKQCKAASLFARGEHKWWIFQGFFVLLFVRGFQLFGNRLQVGCSCQRRCLSATLIRSWVFEELGTNGTKELTKFNDLSWSQSYWDTLSQTQTGQSFGMVVRRYGDMTQAQCPMLHCPEFSHEFCR